MYTFFCILIISLQDCVKMFDLAKMKRLFKICVNIYCKKGIPGVCMFAENIAEICELKFGSIVDDVINVCREYNMFHIIVMQNYQGII